MNPLGIMQGRLSPPVNGRIQAFPKTSWEKEFPSARSAGLELIEWIFEFDEWEKNPVFACPDKLLALSKANGVKVISLCADYFMEKPLLRASKKELNERLALLKDLLARCGSLGIRYVVIPYVDNSEIKTDAELAATADTLRDILPGAAKRGIQLALETSLNPERFALLLKKLDSPQVGVNYDIGNSASLGYDTREELAAYGRRIATIHVKDRVLGGSTVPLGKGNADFDATFSELAKLGFKGPFILQAARDGDELAAAKRYVAFVRAQLSKHFGAPARA